jgi:hypothetical protein
MINNLESIPEALSKIFTVCVCCKIAAVTSKLAFPQRKKKEAKKKEKGKACGNCRSYGNPQRTRIPTGAWESLVKNTRLSHSYAQARRRRSKNHGTLGKSPDQL